MVGESESSCAFPTLHCSTDCLIEYSAGPHSVFTTNLFKVVHNKIHNIQKSWEALQKEDGKLQEAGLDVIEDWRMAGAGAA